jgi:LacI family purine nucleotide synthesis repressor
LATIKDVAQLAGVSPTTVSIVLNGKAIERKIPGETRSRIEQAINQLDYHPNMNARRLRSAEGQKAVIAFYWPLDYRINMLAWHLNSMQTEFKRKKFECELVVVTYKYNYLSKDSTAILKGNYDAVIVGGASSRDITYLESLTLQVPLLFINRSSAKYSTVGVDNEEVARKAAGLFHGKGYREICVFSSIQKYLATSLRTNKFVETCISLGINIPDDHIVKTDNTPDGGISAARIFSEKFGKKIRAIFCDSDIIAMGLVYQLNRFGFRIPGDLELLTIAMTDIHNTTYYTPSISSISLPADRIAAMAVDIIVNSIKKHDLAPQHELVEPRLNFCESFVP